MVVAGICFLLFAIALLITVIVGVEKNSPSWKLSAVYAVMAIAAGIYLLI